MNAPLQYQYGDAGEIVGQLPATGGPSLIGVIATVLIIAAVVTIANLYVRRSR